VDYSQAAAAVFCVFHLGNGRQQEEHLAVAYRRDSRPEPAGKAELLLIFYSFFLVFPFPAERRIGQDIIKLIVFKQVAGKSVALFDVVVKQFVDRESEHLDDLTYDPLVL